MAVQNVPEIGRNHLERRVQQLYAGNDDDVDRPRSILVQPKNLTNQPLSSISSDRSPHAAGRDDAEPVVRAAVGEDDRGHQTAVYPKALILDPLELGPSPDVLFGAKPLNHDSPRRSPGTKPRAACDPSPDGASGRCGRSSCSCGPGTRECACGAGCWAEMYVSLFVSTPAYCGTSADLLGNPARLRLLSRAGRQSVQNGRVKRNPNNIGLFSVLSTNGARRCGLRRAVLDWRSPPRIAPVGSVPKVFHSCGKTCGKGRISKGETRRFIEGRVPERSKRRDTRGKGLKMRRK